MEQHVVTVIMNRQGALLSHVASCVDDIFFNYRTYSFLSRFVDYFFYFST